MTPTPLASVVVEGDAGVKVPPAEFAALSVAPATAYGFPNESATVNAVAKLPPATGVTEAGVCEVSVMLEMVTTAAAAFTTNGAAEPRKVPEVTSRF